MENNEKSDLKNVTKVRDVIKETLSLDPVALPVLSRLRKRLKQLSDLSKAKIQKIPRGNIYVFETVKPKMFITGLKGTYTNGTGIISYSTYKLDGSGNKVVNISSATMPSGREYEVNAEYIIDRTFVETIEYGKAIKVEEVQG